MYIVLFLKPSHFCRFLFCSSSANALALGLANPLLEPLKHRSVFVGKRNKLRRLPNIRSLDQWFLLSEPQDTCKALQTQWYKTRWGPVETVSKTQASALFKRSPGNPETQSALRTTVRTLQLILAKRTRSDDVRTLGEDHLSRRRLPHSSPHT